MRRKGAFDYILLETTGLADPGSSSMMNSTLALKVALNCNAKAQLHRYSGAMKSLTVEAGKILCWMA